jgi:hypothetical protein
MSFSLEQLQLLEEAIAQGALSVKYQDKEIHYSTLDDMLKARDLIRRQLGLTKNSYLRMYTQFKNGL